MTVLGAEWYMPQVQPADEDLTVREPSLQELQYEQLIATVNALREALLSLPAPVVQVSDPDLTAVVNAVNGLRPSATADEIGEAIVARLSGDERGQMEPVLAKLVKSLDTLDFRLRGLGSAGGRGGGMPGSVDITDRGGRNLGTVTIGNPSQIGTRGLTERMFAKAPLDGYSLWFDTADASFIYIAESVQGSAGTDAVFQGIRVQKDASGNPLGEVQQATGFAWNSRGAASWA